ncbi:hypothetical protein STENM36S_05687 [Streptomyces tendae]
MPAARLPHNGAMPIPGTPSRAELAEHLVRTRIAGDVATPRENNLSHYRKLANGDRGFWPCASSTESSRVMSET